MHRTAEVLDNQPMAYGNLCSLFYDATKSYAPEQEVDFYASFIQQNPGRVLEAMSGSGRLQIPLLQRGYLVDGVDNSPIMLARCRERSAALQIAAELYEQSLEALQLPHQYATVTIAVGSFQLLYERAQAVQALKNIQAHMQAEGNLLVDIFVPDMTADPYSTRMARLDNRTTIRLMTRQVFHEEERRADAFCNYELLVDGIVQQREHELIQVTWYTDAEFAQLLQETGFELITIHDTTFRASGPSRVAHAKKRASLSRGVPLGEKV
jgi:SAM-dependent methyltransferase